jgi:RNA polymerase sigma-70 factor, ECF subfamily
MQAAQPLGATARREEPAGTLGDVLYAGGPKPLVLETEWVALVARVGAGDQQALHALYQRTHRLVFTLVLRITGNRETAEELTVDVFYDCWRRASRYDAGNGTVLGWIMNQARSRAIDRLRFDQRKKRTRPDTHEPLAPDAAHVEDSLELKQRGRALRDALGVLTQAERLAIEAAYFSGMTYAEVAERQAQPLGTIKTRIRSGLQKLRQAMTEEGKA